MRQKDRKIERQKERKTKREKDRETERHKDKDGDGEEKERQKEICNRLTAKRENLSISHQVKDDLRVYLDKDLS